MGTPFDTGKTRVWTIKNRAGPANAPAYQSCMKAGSPSRPMGEPQLIRCPDPLNYGKFETVGKIPGELGTPEITLQSRYTEDLSALLEMNRLGCDADVQVHVGRCSDPQDFNSGWEKILVLEAAAPGDWSVSDFGALEPGEQAVINEEMPFRGEEMYEIMKITFGEYAESETVQEIIKVVICDSISCGECEGQSDGCNKIFALTLAVGGSPGAIAEVIYTDDGGTTFGDTEIDTLDVDKDPIDMACVGLNLVVISHDDDSIHWAPKADILDGTETWTEVTEGIVAAGSPNCIISLTPRHTWIGGDGGYIYFTEDPTTSVTPQTTGDVITENVLCMHAYDLNNVIAGTSATIAGTNSVMYTRNGGDTWAVVNGPNGTEDIHAVWMLGKYTWLVGMADGTLYYTLDSGTNWTQKVLPGQTILADIADIQFSTPTVGWLAATTTTPQGRVYRTVDGGYSWYVAPEGTATITANDQIDSIATCDADPNLIWAGGLADDGTDGILLKAS